jgi:hypothetical protein
MRLRFRLLGAVIALAALGGPLAGATLAASPAVATSSGTVATTTTTTCNEGHWPAAVQGVPVQWHAGAAAGTYLWHDARGWHLRVTHRGSGLVTFSGRIVSAQPLTEAPVKLEGRDTVALSADKKVITYRLKNYGHVDGIDFRAPCTRGLSFTFYMGANKLPITRIWVGHAGRHPLQNPFVVRRVL